MRYDQKGGLLVFLLFALALAILFGVAAQRAEDPDDAMLDWTFAGVFSAFFLLAPFLQGAALVIRRVIRLEELEAEKSKVALAIMLLVLVGYVATATLLIYKVPRFVYAQELEQKAAHFREVEANFKVIQEKRRKEYEIAHKEAVDAATSTVVDRTKPLPQFGQEAVSLAEAIRHNGIEYQKFIASRGKYVPQFR